MAEALLLRVSEAAELLSVGDSKVYQLIRSGRLAAVQVDGAIRVTRGAIDDYIASLPPATPGLGALEDSISAKA